MTTTLSLSDHRIIGRCSSPEPGPTLIAVGGMHGNEPAGVLALERVFEALTRDGHLARGDFVALRGNLAALERGVRYLDADLNRRFDGAPEAPEEHERLERDEVLHVVRSAIADARGPVALIDLHTTSGDGGPFAVFADTIASRNFARQFPVPVVLGLEEELEGTLVDHIGLSGHVAVGFEGGQHQDPESVESLEAVTYWALDRLGLTARRRSAFDRLAELSGSAPRILEVIYRHDIAPEDEFRMRPGFRSFQRVDEGLPLADDAEGSVVVPREGFLLMPLYQTQGNDGFFVVQPVHPFWLSLSAALRHARAGRIAHWLPGVSRDPGHRHRVHVNQRVARWYSLQILHLLGYRRRGKEGDVLLMERRAHDLP